MRVWLDMANSPHPVLLGPVAAEMGRRGHDVVVTTRDHAQTRELTVETWPDTAVIGSESPGSRVGKALSIGDRVLALRRHVRRVGVAVAVSLNSYAQIAAAKLDGIPAVTLMDYEYQPANHLAFRLATRIAVPDAFPAARLRGSGARPGRVARFDGFKEELYLDRAVGSPGIDPVREGVARALFRPPAEGALYHRGANAEFDRLVEHAAERDDVEAVVLPRLSSQREHYAAIDCVTVPPHTVDGLALLRTCDVFIGAGGTMSREAALLGVRAYTAFAGRRPAVDEALIHAGRLHDLSSVNSELVDWSPRAKEEIASQARRREVRAVELRAWFVDLVEAALGELG